MKCPMSFFEDLCYEYDVAFTYKGKGGPCDPCHTVFPMLRRFAEVDSDNVSYPNILIHVSCCASHVSCPCHFTNADCPKDAARRLGFYERYEEEMKRVLRGGEEDAE